LGIDFQVVHKGVFGTGLGDEDIVAQFVEEARPCHGAGTEQHVEGDVAPLDAAADEAPLAEDDGAFRLVGGAERQRIAPQDVAPEHIAHGLRQLAVETFALRGAGVPVEEDAIEPLAALGHVVLENLNAVDTCHGLHHLLIHHGDIDVAGGGGAGTVDDIELALQDAHQKIACAAGRLEETAVDALRLGLHQVEHGIDLALGGEHLAVLAHSLAAFDLVAHSRTGNKNERAGTHEACQPLTSGQ